MIKKVLCWSDSATAGTGFGVVSKHVISALHATGKYDIDHLAINFHGDFVDRSIVPWQMQPAKLLDAKDPHGKKMFFRSLMKKEYDIVWILNDLYVTHEVVEVVEKIKETYITKGKKPPIFIYYYPVDCSVQADKSGMIDAVDIPVCYTKHGKLETIKTKPHIESKLIEIPHGVDTNVFRPLSRNEISVAKGTYFKKDPSTYVVVQVNRNSTRKQIPYSILAFKEFRKYVPNSIMYCHTQIVDQAGDLTDVMKDLGLSMQNDVLFPARYSAGTPFPDHVLNNLYNTGDMFLTTHLGEGWGLSQWPYTCINTTDGVKYLKDVEIGDRVLTSNGEYEEVLDTTYREENVVYKLKPFYSPEVITSDLHPYYTSRDGGKTLQWLNVKQLKVGDYIAIVKPVDTRDLPKEIDLTQCVNCEYSDTQVWHKMGFSPNRQGLSISKVQKEFDISKRVAEDALNKFRGKNIPSRCLPGSEAYEIFTRLVSKYTAETIKPIKINRFIPIDEIFLEFIGWYLAEGSSENGVRVELSLHKKEKHIAEKFQLWCRDTLGIKSIVEDFDNKSRLRISNSIFAKFLQQECGKGAYNKHIPSWLIESPTKLGPLLRGLLLGDGCFSKAGQISLCTVSPSLAYQTRDLCASVGIMTAIRQDKKRIGNYDPYNIIIHHREKLGQHIQVEIKQEVISPKYIDVEKYFLVPIQSIEKVEDNKELLYDICVDNSHSFVANGIVAHNTITEAMAAGVPVVAPDNTCMSQQLGENSERGYLYPCNDHQWIDASGFRKKGIIKDIVASMMEVYNTGPKEQNLIAKSARDWAMEHSWEKVAQQWVDLFEKVVSDRPSDNDLVVTQEV